MRREYFIKCKTDLIPNEVFYVFMTINGNAKDAKEITEQALAFCKSDIKKSNNVDIPINKIEILVFSLLQTTTI
ncbi:MAG: hypothetical protein WC055_02250 [Melioribacteraceae bacterium]